MKTARDIMTKNPKTIGSGEELRNTIKLFLESSIHHAPVVTPMGEVLGIFSEFGLVRAALKHFLDNDNHEKIINHKELLEEAICVYEDDSLDEVVKAMMKSPNRRVLVISVVGKLSGIISPKDLLFCLHGETDKQYNLQLELENTRKYANKLGVQIKDMQDKIKIYQNFIQDSPNMIHSTDKFGIIIMANKKIHQLLGYEDGELIGQNIKILYPDSIIHDALDSLKQIQENRVQKSTYTTMLKKDGTKIRADIASSALVDAHGNFLSTITISREIDSDALLRALHGIQS